MTIQYINVMVGSTLKNGDVVITSKGKGAAQVSHVSLAYDDTVVLSQNALLAAVRQILLDVQSASGLPKG